MDKYDGAILKKMGTSDWLTTDEFAVGGAVDLSKLCRSGKLSGLGRKLGSMAEAGLLDRQRRNAWTWEYRRSARGTKLLQMGDLVNIEAIDLTSEIEKEAMAEVSVTTDYKQTDLLDVLDKMSEGKSERNVLLMIMKESSLVGIIQNIIDRNGMHAFDYNTIELIARNAALEKDVQASLATATEIEAELNRIRSLIPPQILKAYLEPGN